MFLIQIENCRSFSIASDIDPEYSKVFKNALKKIKVICYDCKFSNKGLEINNKINFIKMTDKMIEAFEGTRKAGSIAASALDKVAEIVKPGVTTEKIDKLCYEFINDKSSLLLPLCSIEVFQNLVVHLLTMSSVTEYQNKILKEGDIVNVDVTALKDGWHGDTSRMFFVGEVSVKAKKISKKVMKQ